ncbi:hypothetical protein HK405_007369, partial [Cladochytrium tenue]
MAAAVATPKHTISGALVADLLADDARACTFEFEEFVRKELNFSLDLERKSNE